MRRLFPRRVQAVAALAMTLLALAGADFPVGKKKKAEVTPKVEENVGSLADVIHRTELQLEGVGLVVGLDNAGADPPPSMERQKLLDEMKKAGVENPNAWLKNPDVSMVLVRLTVPQGASTTDRLDVDVALPMGSGTKNLSGGYLLATRLREMRVLNGGAHEGLEMAFAQGPVMTGSLSNPDDPKVGRVLGGGRVRKEIPFTIALRENRKSFRASALVESVVNTRFPQTRGVQQKGSVTAKTDQVLELTVPRVYHENQTRFFRVLKALPIVDSPALRVQRTAIWGRDLLDPAKAETAAIKLEGLGLTAADAIKEGLASPDPGVRFYAAEALAYLNDPSCVGVLGEAAAKAPQYRPFALAALSAMDQSAAHLKLRKLMDEPDVETRYGAFNALRAAAADDPFLGRVRVIDDAEEPDDELNSDSMAVAIAAASRRKPRQDDPFALYLVDCEGPPMVHVSRTRRCEIVVFGRGMKLLTPVVLGTGSILVNASDGDESVEVSKILPSKSGDGQSKVASGLGLGDVIRRAANLGATYPELVTILQAADRQRNLPGPLVVDAVPGASPVYVDASLAAKSKAPKKSRGKKDPSVQRAGAEEKPKRRSILDRVFNRDVD